MAIDGLTTEKPGLGTSSGDYRGGWVDRLVMLPHRLPGPALGWLLVLSAGVMLVANAVLWLSGATQVGSVESNLIVPAAILVYFFGLIGLMAQVGRSAFDEFRPALVAGTSDPDRLRFELTRIPDRQALFAIGFGIGVSVLLITTTGSQDTSDVSPAVATVAWALWWMALGAMALAVFYTLRQLRWVSRLYAAATSIDLFDTQPINAFSRLTATSAMGILVIGLVMMGPWEEPSSTGQDAAGFLLDLGPLPLLLPVAVASFVLPLRGMHRRLVVEKGRLLSASNARLKQTLALIHQTVDTKDFEQADELQKTLTSLLAEREVLAKLATWPWSPGMLRGFATATLLPVGLWLVFRVLERVVQ